MRLTENSNNKDIIQQDKIYLSFTEETWNKEIEKNGDDYRKIMKAA
jgi:hypothetical protein